MHILTQFSSENWGKNVINKNHNAKRVLEMAYQNRLL